MRTVNIREAKAQFSRLVDAAAGGEEIVIAKAGTPTARLVPLGRLNIERRFGGLKGKIHVADEFDAPLPPSAITATICRHGPVSQRSINAFSRTRPMPRPRNASSI